MLTKIFTDDVVRSQLKALLAVMFALQPQQRRLIVPAAVRVRTAVPACKTPAYTTSAYETHARKTYVVINEES